MREERSGAGTQTPHPHEPALLCKAPESRPIANPDQRAARRGGGGGDFQAPLFNGLDISSSSSFILHSDKPIPTSRQESTELGPVVRRGKSREKPAAPKSRPGHVQVEAVIARICPDPN